MSKATVNAVMRVTIEIPVRASQGEEKMEDMLVASQREAEGILRNKLPDDFRVAGPIEFSHCVVRASK